MPKISNKAKLMPTSAIRRLVPFAENAKEKGRTVYHLNIGQPDIKTPQVVVDRIKNLKREFIEYSHSAGLDSYRNGLVSYYKSFGIDVEKKDIMVTTGGSEAINFAIQTCFDPHDEVIIPEPFYANYTCFTVSSGVKVIPITSTIETGFALPKISEFERLITPNTKGIIICNPGNPTGYLYTQEELNSLRDLVKKYDLFLFSDEVYREFCYDNETCFSALNLKGIENNVVVFDSISKRYSMCGARIGTLISKNKEVMQMALKFGIARLSPPTFGQIAGEAALSTPASYFEEVVNEYVLRRNIVVEGLNKIPGVYCPTPKGAFYTIAKLPIDNSDRFCQWLLKEFEYENQTVMLSPATGFYETEGLGVQEVRIAYVLNQDALKVALKCIEEALKVYPGKLN